LREGVARFRSTGGLDTGREAPRHSPPVTPAFSVHEVLRGDALASQVVPCHGPGMFVITDADAAAIRTLFHQEGELSAAIELRRRFPGLGDNAKARACARTIAGWTPPPDRLDTVTQLSTRKNALGRLHGINGTEDAFGHPRTERGCSRE
jgi:hypothetical protein